MEYLPERYRTASPGPFIITAIVLGGGVCRP